jgi:hypothetical protein
MPNKTTNPNFQLSQTKKAIEVLGEKINKTLFNGEVEPWVTTIQPQGRKSCIGWATIDKRWSSKDKKKIEYRELNICAEYLHQPEVVFECVVHELVHLWNAGKNIKDCSKSGVHNKKFKVKAEEAGLTVEHSDKHGHAHTNIAKKGPAEKLLKSLKNLKKDFPVSRKLITEKAKAKTKNLKWSCDCTNVRCATELVATCGECGEEFVLQD